MKIGMNKIYQARKFLLIALMLIWISCDQSQEVNPKDGGYLELRDAYLQIETPVVGFQAGTEEYEISFNVVNGTEDVNEVRIYSTFTDAGTGLNSNEVLLATYSIESSVIEELTDSFTYTELKAGLTVAGDQLPESDVNVPVGSGWALRFEGTLASGEIIRMAGTINIAVLSRFAGMYRVVDSHYFRIGVDNGDWNGGERYIGSVDETTFAYNDFWGPFAWTGKQFNFTIDFDDNSITVPIIVEGLFSGTRAINCTDDAAIFTSVPCNGSNILIPDDVTGKHRIKLTYGYFTDGSGPREFYEELEKIVD